MQTMDSWILAHRTGVTVVHVMRWRVNHTANRHKPRVRYPYTSSEADQPSKRAAKKPFQASTMLSLVYDTVRGFLRVVPGTSDAQRASLVEVNSTSSVTGPSSLCGAKPSSRLKARDAWLLMASRLRSSATHRAV